MTPKEKAAELIKKFTYVDSYNNSGNAKAAAIVCCDEIILCAKDLDFISENEISEYWTAVKTAIES